MEPLYIWAGGKNKMITKYRLTPKIPVDGYDTYAEPFFGGGAMMVYLYKNAPNIKRFIMNDINCEIVGIYKAIRDDVEGFQKKMIDLEFSYISLDKEGRKRYYYDLREVYTKSWSHLSSTEESATLYFLMKTGFNGIWQTKKDSNGRFATPSGLLNQKKGCYNRENVYEWHRFLQRVDIFCGDWKDSCKGLDGKVFYFMDPPYRDSYTQYGQVFGDDKHVELINFCKEKDLAGNIVFYCNRECNDRFYETHRGHLIQESYSIKYTAGRRATDTSGKKTAKDATEILLHSNLS